jgi:hypothetical protein
VASPAVAEAFGAEAFSISGSSIKASSQAEISYN